MCYLPHLVHDAPADFPCRPARNDSHGTHLAMFDGLSTTSMHDAVKTFTSFHNRYYFSQSGVEASVCLHNQIVQIISRAPMATYISLEHHTYRFRNFDHRPLWAVRNASLPLTIIGAHLDSANFFFPLVPAPGLTDDGSGSVSILEAIRTLAGRGCIPDHGPVEFHWYCGDEAGLLSSREVAAYTKGQGAQVNAMIEFVSRTQPDPGTGPRQLRTGRRLLVAIGHDASV